MVSKVAEMNNKSRSSPETVSAETTASGKKPKWWGANEKWEAKDSNSKLWFLYAVVAAVAITISSFTLGGYSGLAAGAFVLVILHTVVWPLFTDKTSTTTKVVVSCIIIYFALVPVFPDDVPRAKDAVWAGTKGTVHEVANILVGVTNPSSSVSATSTAVPTAQQVQQQNLPTFVTTTRVLHLEPGGIFKSVPTPPGTRIIHDVIWSCPQGCIMEIEHTSDMMCKNWAGTETDEAGRVWHVGTYNGDTTCTVTSIGVTRFRERFAALPGATNWTLEFPNNLVGIITSFGTIEAIGPIEITVSTVTS